MNATDILNKAAQHMADRASTYDKPEGERSMGRAVEAFNAITGRDLSESEGWLLLQVLKSVRLFTRPGYHADSAEDGVAYAALVAEAKSVEAVSEAWPEDTRIDAIGQNGATGEHYTGKPNWNDAPKWAQWLAQSPNGGWYWFNLRPIPKTDGSGWFLADSSCFYGQIRLAGTGIASPMWRDTLELRPA